MERFVSIIRTQNALIVRHVRQNFRVDFTDCAAVMEFDWDNSASWYEFVDTPVVLSPSSSPLLEAWNALSSAIEPEAEAVRRVLAETVLAQPTVLPPVTMQLPAASVKPTAAHPRAYSGTKFKPPKPKSAAAQDWRPFLCDPRSLDSVAAEARLPESFRVSLFPLVRDQSSSEAAEILALYWALGLDSDPDRLAVAAYLFSQQSTQNTRDWCRAILIQPPEHWTTLLHLLIESGAHTVEMLPSFSEMLAKVLGGNDPVYRAYWLLHGLTTQISPAYLLAGYRLADVFNIPYKFHTIRRSSDFPLQTVLGWGAYCQGSGNYYPGMLLSFWEQCGLRDGLGECLEKTDYAQLTPNAACCWLALLESPYWDDWGDLPDDEASGKWTAAQPWLEPMTTLLQEVLPAYQNKCFAHLKEYISQCDTQEEIQNHWPAAFTLIRRLCSLPFTEKSGPVEAIANFLTNLSSPWRERFLAASDASFKRFEQSCRQDNDARLIESGVETVTRYQAEFSVRCFEGDPTRLFHAAKLLGTLPTPMRDTVVQAFVSLPDEAPRTALARLEQAALDALALGFSPEIRAQTEPHALQIQQLVWDNRKALRKFLAAHWEGRIDYRQMHPLTRRWLAAHPALDAEKWLAGIRLQAKTEIRGTFTLAIEQDPLEALKLGTYVGSCLGLGGSFTYSAAAVVLDINKQVVYARDKRGTVVGRQLVAISEADQLVCYDIYPLSAQKDLGAAFREFDAQLASALDLPIYCRAETEDYEIAHILSHDWWDDGPWDLASDTHE